ncbi:MAG: DNA modification methylase, partial [Candidatus Omnitrophota bacterium]
KQAEDLAKSLERFNLADPIVINKNNTIIGGHQRINILKTKVGNNGYEVDCRIPSRKLTPEEEKELNLRLNKNLGQWDFDLLANFDEEMLKDVGFDSKELDKIFQLDEKPEDDNVPEVRETSVKLGDMFKLGEHVLLAGDCTTEANVARLMGQDRANIIFTDPPYAVNYGADQDTLNKKSGGKSKLTARPIAGDNLTAEECSEKLWRPSFKNMYDFAQDDCSFYMTMCQGGDQMMMMMMMMSEHWQVKHELIWVKSSPVFSMGRLDYDYQHEPILFGWKKKHNWYGGGQFLKSIWEVDKPSKSPEHPTMKPIALMENALLNSSQRNEICMDLFGGSGSTLIACEKLNRKCRMMEIDPIYCQVIIDRWEKFTNQKASKLNGKTKR